MRIHIGKPFMHMLVSLVMLGGFSAIAEGATCTKASLNGKWYAQVMDVQVNTGNDSDRALSKWEGSVSFKKGGKFVFNGVIKEVDFRGASSTETESDEGTYSVSKSCIATLKFHGDPGEGDSVERLRIFPTRGLFWLLENNDRPDRVSLGFGIKAE